MVLGELWVGMAQPGRDQGERDSDQAAPQRGRHGVASTLVLPASSPSASTGSVRTKRAPPLADDSTRTLTVHDAHVLGDQGQTQARCPSRCPAARRRAAVEALEDLGALTGIDARPRVVNRHLHLRIVARPDADGRSPPPP